MWGGWGDMSLSQSKIKLGILYRLQQAIEKGDASSSYEDILSFYGEKIPQGRVRFAIEELEVDGSIEDVNHPYSNESYYRISRSGIDEVDRALKIPNSFIYRIHNNEPDWIFSDDARNAVLTKKSKSSANGPDTHVFPIPPASKAETGDASSQPFIINNNVNPSFSNQNSTTQANEPEAKQIAKSGTKAAWIGVFVAILAIIVSVLLTWKFG
ncbi:MAG: hypothetical protein COA41_13840 [Sphingopyxis sp.]|nr:MAG: hypothetical protein COA41_13840 [Sphingopyxis sp.]